MPENVTVKCADCKGPVVTARENDGEPVFCATCGAKEDWSRQCETCGGLPVVQATGLCGPCTFGESGTAGGNW